MDKVYVVVSHFSDSNIHQSSSQILFATSKRSLAEKAISRLKDRLYASTLEIVETDFYEV